MLRAYNENKTTKIYFFKAYENFPAILYTVVISLTSGLDFTLGASLVTAVGSISSSLLGASVVT